MSELAKATLQEITADDKAEPLGEPVKVQFNPTTLRLSLSNTVSGGETRGNPARQYLGSSSTTLDLDLVFDTADEGTTEQPRDVREKTALVEKFVIPRGQGEDKSAPPKLRFHWGTLIIDGVVDNISLDFDLFAADGTPLRAKVNLSIKEQDSKYMFLEQGPGANKSGGAPSPGGVGVGLGFSAGVGFSAGGGFSAGFSAGVSIGASANFGVAVGGESSAEFAARMGLDSAAWRGLDIGGSSSLSLDAGLEVGFNTNLTASAGLGTSSGVQSGSNASPEATFGLAAGGGADAVSGVGKSGALASGFALSAAGGVTSAVESVRMAKSEAAAQKTRAAFGAPPASHGLTAGASVITSSRTAAALSPASANAAAHASTQPRPGLPEQPRPALASTGLPSHAEEQTAPAAPAPPRADTRAVSFGYGVPLRPTLGGGPASRAAVIDGRVARPSRATGGALPPSTSDPTKPPWVALPAGDRARAAADKKQKQSKACGCTCACRHK